LFCSVRSNSYAICAFIWQPSDAWNPSCHIHEHNDELGGHRTSGFRRKNQTPKWISLGWRVYSTRYGSIPSITQLLVINSLLFACIFFKIIFATYIPPPPPSSLNVCSLASSSGSAALQAKAATLANAINSLSFQNPLIVPGRYEISLDTLWIR
jgi:hypothetical protein